MLFLLYHFLLTSGLSILKPESVSKMLVNQMLLCFGLVFAFQVGHNKAVMAGISNYSSSFVVLVIMRYCYFIDR